MDTFFQKSSPLSGRAGTSWAHFRSRSGRLLHVFWCANGHLQNLHPQFCDWQLAVAFHTTAPNFTTLANLVISFTSPGTTPSTCVLPWCRWMWARFCNSCSTMERTLPTRLGAHTTWTSSKNATNRSPSLKRSSATNALC